MTKHLIIPDVQMRPSHDPTFLRWAGQYIVDSKPDTIICIGDFADMESLCSYDVGKKSFEGRTYIADIKCAFYAMNQLLLPLRREQARQRLWKKKVYQPRMVLTLGNHEQRIVKAVESDRRLEGTIHIDDLQYRAFGWEVVPFLDVIEIDNILYSHYFTTGVMGRPVTSANALVSKKHQSCVMGHVQKPDISVSQYRGDGTPLLGLFVGVYSPYDEPYLSSQEVYTRQIWELDNIKDGFAYPKAITLTELEERYGQICS